MKRPSFYWLLGFGLWLSAAAWAQPCDGSAELGPNAHIEGDAVIVGGDLHADPSARIDHSPVEVSWSRLEERAPVLAGVKNWVVQGPILGRPLPHRFGWWWIAALACAGV